MEYLPLFHNLRAKPCLVVGGGQVALRRVRILCEAQAKVTVVAPQVDDGIYVLADQHQGQVSITVREFAPADISGKVLIVAATNDKNLNQQVSRLAMEQNTAINVVDQPSLCSVIFPAIIDRSPVQVAVSSGGASPTLARLLRTQIESLLPAKLGRLADLARSFRDRVNAGLSDTTARRVFWESALQGEVAELVYSNNIAEATSSLTDQLEAIKGQGASPPKGEVYLVGGGPGDPDLLTFRALRLMQQADVVLYDRLISPQILELVRRDAERIFVGKKAGSHPVTQANINAKLAKLAGAGKRVLRLKGGDPFIFGRGGEEIEELSEQGINFQVVPGITAASGCASYAGIPLTHRDHAQSVRFITGHKKDKRLELDWPNLVNDRETLVFYMGLGSLEEICRKLIDHGLSAVTPAALIESGTMTKQKVFTGNLRDLPETVRRNEVQAPTLLIIGQVVALRNKLSWYDKNPGDIK